MPDLMDPIDGDPVGPAKRHTAGTWAGKFDHAMAWFRAHERWVFLATVAFQLLVLAGMIVGEAIPYRTGDVVLLRVVPVDPRDLFRGDYVILGYEISRVPPQGVAGLPLPRNSANTREWQGRTVYVTLEPESDGLHYRGGPVRTIPPPPGTRFIEGTLTDPSRIAFGIESYFVQEGKGKEYEAAIREHRLSAEVALTSSGRAALRGLKIE
jgi:uncharacterized membrane-anchored protein